MVVRVTDHAVQRYQQRIEDVSPAEALRAIMSASPAIEFAARFKCRAVVLGSGVRLCLDGTTVVTVLPKRGRR